MNTLVLGSGGREHALAWKIANSPSCQKVYLHPGNSGSLQAGIPNLGEVDLKDKELLATTARKAEIELIVIGPEALLAEGYADFLRTKAFSVVGPSREAAQLETSKIFAKKFMVRAGIPTANFTVVESLSELDELLDKQEQWPLVLKLDALAAGKGVAIPENREQAQSFARSIWLEEKFGPGPHKVLVEDCLRGREISYIGLCDGKAFLPLASATDYKRVGEGDTGPNTGGMGCISPSPYLNANLSQTIQEQIIFPLLEQLKRDGLFYRGTLYAGLMVDEQGQPKVLEFNVRFGDPETQVTLLRLESDLVTLLKATAEGRLSDVAQPTWREEVSIYVVGAAEGYPQQVQKGDTISGIPSIDEDVIPFFAGVSQKGEDLTTSGGRVLGLGTLASDFPEARDKVYANLKKVRWNGQHYRTDIGANLTRGQINE